MKTDEDMVPTFLQSEASVQQPIGSRNKKRYDFQIALNLASILIFVGTMLIQLEEGFDRAIPLISKGWLSNF